MYNHLQHSKNVLTSNVLSKLNTEGALIDVVMNRQHGNQNAYLL